MLKISRQISIPENEIQFEAIRAQGSGGQNVNKVSSAIHLRFDINNSSLPDSCKEKLLAISDQRISKNGIIVIKAQRFRSQEKNREDGLKRLASLILRSLLKQQKRKSTQPSRSAVKSRLEYKTKRGSLKGLRRKIISQE